MFRRILSITLFVILFVAGLRIVAYTNYIADSYGHHGNKVWGDDLLETNLVLVIICAIRCDEAFEDTSHQYIPRLWNELRPQGSIATNLFSTCLTKTTSGHYTILTGARDHHQNIEWISHPSARPRLPTLFEYLRRQKFLDETQVWSIMPKFNGYLIDHSLHPYGGPDYRSSIAQIARTEDTQTLETSFDIMDIYEPKFLQITFTSVDLAAHSGDWEGYLKAIQTVDELVFQLWERIENDPAYTGNTTLIVTGDHGRHDDFSSGFSSHGGTDHGSEHILFLALGPDIKQDFVVERRIDLIDVAPTIGRVLDLELPFSEGSVIDEIFLDPNINRRESIQRSDINGASRITHTPGRSVNPDLASDGNDIHLIWMEEDTSSQLKEWDVAYVSSSDDGQTWSTPFNPFDPAEFDGSLIRATLAMHNNLPAVSASIYHGFTDPAGRRKYGWSLSHTQQRENSVWEMQKPLRDKDNKYLWERLIPGNPGFSAGSSHAFTAFLTGCSSLTLYGNETGNDEFNQMYNRRFSYFGDILYMSSVKTAAEGPTAHVIFEMNSSISKIIYSRMSNEDVSPDTLFRVDASTNPSYSPAVTLAGGKIHLTWADLFDDTWHVAYRSISPPEDSLSGIIILSQTDASAINADIAANGDTVAVAWETWKNGVSDIYVRVSYSGGNIWDKEIRVSRTGDLSIRPALTHHDGHFFVAWQELEDGNWEIYMAEVPLRLTR